MPAHTARSRIGEAKCGDGSIVNEHMWAANQLADLLAKKGAGMVAHPPGVIRDLAGRTKLTRQVAIYVGQLTREANQHKAADGGRCADAQKLEACVARKKALKKQLGTEKEASSAAVGAKPGGTKAASASGDPHNLGLESHRCDGVNGLGVRVHKSAKAQCG